MSIRRAENRKCCLLAILFLAALATAQGAVDLGIDVLEKSDYAMLRGKRVGLITNQTGINSQGTPTRALLFKHCNLVALYTPEHGLDGTEKAGRYVKSRRDRLTGVMAYSLYGPTRRPTPDMLRGIDVLVFDIQDIGCRSYTYISTMGRCMEAAGENGILFVVLDRPNPLGGLRVEGPSVEPRWISFVSPFPIPYVHGMTVGELAKMANARGWNSGRCDLTVVPMRGWSRDMTWQGTGLRWVPSSPNIPRGTSPLYYVATGLVGELSGPGTGVGSLKPFESIAAKWLNAANFTRYFNSLNLLGVAFEPFRSGQFEGSRIRIEPKAPANLTGLNIYAMAEMARTNPRLFRQTKAAKLNLFYKCYGSASIRSQIENGVPPGRIVASWKSYEHQFRSARGHYLLY